MLDTIIIFLLVLTILVFIHELGHFLAARMFGIRVDEFAIGFPPRLFSFMWGKTRYALNLLPLGGYVRIYGEMPEDEVTSDSILAKSGWKQAVVLVAGIVFNILFAWLLISGCLAFGTKTETEGFPQSSITDRQVMIDFVLADSPAAKAGLVPGDQILSAVSQGTSTSDLATSSITVASIQDLTAEGNPIFFTYDEDGVSKTTTVTPVSGLVAGKEAIGISMDETGIVKLNPFQSLWYGAIETYNLAIAVGGGLIAFIGSIFVGKADLSSVSGPVGIAGVVGQASRMGFSYLVTIVAIISVNLAAINLVPFPALDGGRVVIVVIEAIIRRRLNPNVVNMINLVGFILLITLMIVITIKDVSTLFH